MRERAAAAGGTIDIGAAPAGGFRVAATLPLDIQPAAKPAVTTPTQEAAR
jgi:signal transduction histidine kinase